MSPGAVHDQELLFHQQAVSNDGFGATRTQEPGDCSQQLGNEFQQFIRGGAGQGNHPLMARPSRLLVPGQSIYFAIHELRRTPSALSSEWVTLHCNLFVR